MPLKSGQFTPRERSFVKHMVQTNSPTEAARRSGYPQPASIGGVLMKRAGVVEKIQAEVTARLRTEGARIGVGTLIDIAGGKEFPAGARVMAARELVKLSGVGADTPDDEKSPDMMTRAELEAAARSIRDKIADLEGGVIDLEPIEATTAPVPSVFD
ncbi:hypothetical protein [Methylorubrum thiocyanatum]|uniref:hypothetical protein n=1 Tax=Methylorubrum thiocyanatum TaxID=47958 RepID=UPI00364697EF